MTDKKLDKWLAEAEKAYARQDKRKGAKLVDDILRKDFSHPETWQLLYRLFGKGRTFDEFQRAFTLQYYPDQLYQLRKTIPLEPVESPQKKASFFSRLFRRNKVESSSGSPTSQASLETPGPLNPPAPAQVISKETAPARPSSQIVIPRDDSPAKPPTPPAPEPGITAMLSQKPKPSTERPSSFGKATSMAQSLAALRRAETLSTREKIHVVVVDDIVQTRETVIRSLRFQDNIEVVGTATNGVKAIDLVREVLPDVVIMDVNMPDMDGITATGIIKQEVPHAQIIILTVQDDVDYIRKAMMAGARDFLAKPPVIEELIAAVQRAAQIAKTEREKLPPPGALPSDTPAAVLGRGKVITIYSPRGGSGCTTLASNLAAVLVNPETRVVVVDGTLQFGDVEVFFNVQNHHTIVDLASSIDGSDIRYVEQILTTHSSGIKLLLSSRPESAELISGQQFSHIIQLLSQYYDYVIVDSSHRLNDVTLAGLDSSDVVLLVTTQDIPSIARTRKFLDLMPAMELDKARTLIVMNQYENNAGITPEKINQAFRTKIAVLIPNSMEVVIPSINRGYPFMLHKEMAVRPIGRAMLALVEAIRERLVELDRAVVEQKPA